MVKVVYHMEKWNKINFKIFSDDVQSILSAYDSYLTLD